MIRVNAPPPGSPRRWPASGQGPEPAASVGGGTPADSGASESSKAGGGCPRPVLRRLASESLPGEMGPGARWLASGYCDRVGPGWPASLLMLPGPLGQPGRARGLHRTHCCCDKSPKGTTGMRSPSRAMPLGPPYCLDRDSRGRTGCGRRRGGGRETDFTPPGEIVSPAAGARRGAPGRIQVSRKAAPPAGPVRSGSTPRGERQRARLSGACEGHIGRLSGHSSQGPNEPARGRPGAHRTLPHPKRPPAPLSPRRRRR